LQPRTQPLLLNDGFPVSLRETVRLHVPAGKPILPESAEETSGPLRWRLAWKQDGEAIVGELNVSLPAASLDPAGAAKFQAQLIRLRAAASAPISPGSAD
jgi:hypothetical protein